MPKQVILYRAHHNDDCVQHELNKLTRELPGFDLVVVSFHEAAPADAGFSAPVFMTTADDIRALPYGGKVENFVQGQRRGHEDLPVLKFFRTSPDYTHYWIIEYDVRWSGNWRLLFEELFFSPADLLATSVAQEAEDPGWSWWQTLHRSGAAFAPEHRIKAFLPFCRISCRALAAIDQAYQTGTSGHYEVTWPSICAHQGLVVEDIGGEGRFTPPCRKGRLYTSTIASAGLSPGTCVFRPSYDLAVYNDNLAKGALSPALWHPVKSVAARREQFNLQPG